jgi:hypothetical protein
MNNLLDSSMLLDGASPWAVGSFEVADKPIIIRAFGLGADDLICVKMVRKVQLGSGNVTVDGCGTKPAEIETKAASEYFTDCSVKVCICAKQPWTVVSLSGDYELEVRGSNVTLSAVTVTADIYHGASLPICAAQCKACEPAITVASPVTAVVTGLPCPLPATFMYNGAQTTLSAFIADIKVQVTGAMYNASTCSFTAPAGSAFPSLAVSAVPTPAPVYCPSQPLVDGGFGYHIADPKDPAATVEIAPCAGDTSVDSIWVYPTAGTGHTAKVTACDGTTIGYGANQSNCAVACPCPEMNVTVNNAAPVNNVSVAAPIVNNAFAPTTNVAAPAVTTNVAAPVVNLPAPNVVGAGYDANGKLTITRSDGTTVQTTDLPSC